MHRSCRHLGSHLDRIPALNPEVATWPEFKTNAAVQGSFGAAVAEAVTESLVVGVRTGARTAILSTGAQGAATVEGGFREFTRAEVLIKAVSRGDRTA